MKKLAIVGLAMLLVSPAFSNNFGAGIKLGAGENDPKTMERMYDMGYGPKELTKNYAVLGAEALYEFNLNNEDNKLGVKIGIDVYGENELKAGGDKLTENSYAIPVTAYYKWDKGIKNWSFYAGGGFSFIKTEVEAEGYFKLNEHKTFPHVVAGTEYRFCKLFALGIEAKYNFNAKVTKGSDILSDRSGLSGTITGRFYF